MQVRVVEFNTTTSFREQLQVISETGVFISVHTSNLANAQFLCPGSAVFEIIQRNWVWENLDRSFQVSTVLHSAVPMQPCAYLPFRSKSRAVVQVLLGGGRR